MLPGKTLLVLLEDTIHSLSMYRKIVVQLAPAAEQWDDIRDREKTTCCR